VALEDWLNDGVPLALCVAETCLGGWYGANATASGDWQVAGEAILPEQLTVPTLVVIPAQDRIVPPSSARALVDRLPKSDVLAPALGHIGMVVSREAPSLVWAPLSAWLLRRAARRRSAAQARKRAKALRPQAGRRAHPER
jgi:polyhydroxyalkanoate synthase subunit PhaC